MILYQIKDWDVHFENSKSRERERCSFCCIPNKQDGLGYGLLMREKDGESLYGAFVAVVLIASKQKKRHGYLTDDGLPAGCPLSARQLSVKCQFSETTIQRMLDVTSSESIGWVLKKESARRVPAECPPSALEGKGKKGIEEKEHEGVPASPTPTKTPPAPGVSVLDQIQDRMNLLYKRGPQQHWSYAEETALAEVSRRPAAIEELNQICYWRDHMHPDDRRRFFPQSVNSLLSRWTEALDKARVQAPIPKPKPPPATRKPELKAFLPSPDLARKFRQEALGCSGELSDAAPKISKP